MINTAQKSEIKSILDGYGFDYFNSTPRRLEFKKLLNEKLIELTIYTVGSAIFVSVKINGEISHSEVIDDFNHLKKVIDCIQNFRF